MGAPSQKAEPAGRGGWRGPRGGSRHVLMALDEHTHAFDLGFARYAREAGWVVDRGSGLLSDFRDWSRWDGLVVWLYRAKVDLLRRLTTLRKPVVYVGIPKAESPWVQVSFDNDAIGTQVADYFLARGFRRFMYLGLFAEAEARGAPYARRVTARGGTFIAHPCRQAPGETISEAVARFVREALTRQATPLALFAFDDLLASMAVGACLDAGIDVPGEVAVVGVDRDDVFNELARIPISSMDPDHARHGWTAAQALDLAMRGEAPGGTRLVPPLGVVTRHSSDILCIEHAGMRKALRFISQRYADPIHVRDVARSAGMSRRQVEIQFDHHLQRSPHEEIEQRRVDHACRLLRETTLKVDYIGAVSGLSNGERLSRVFRRRLLCSPREYRLRSSGSS